ncbi:hypothetical protein OUZ56_007405 [Daphnia magna]|uniref:Uncharacterized protein n=1 Tax=Daphnia magna TaxID=35525 RepID=A0ABR0A9V4_9CRUS|nr:hypothetical protein OUZ56_007405 [Daphnia magna]
MTLSKLFTCKPGQTSSHQLTLLEQQTDLFTSNIDGQMQTTAMSAYHKSINMDDMQLQAKNLLGDT